MMKRIAMVSRRSMLVGLFGVALGAGAAGSALALPAGPQAATAGKGGKQLQAQLHDVQSKVSQAQSRNSELQAQVARMERENAEREERLKQRDGEIAALQQKLEAAGTPTAASSAGH
jgi:septal ring factor EnvC (AmiA/AmiB activator)